MIGPVCKWGFLSFFSRTKRSREYIAWLKFTWIQFLNNLTLKQFLPVSRNRGLVGFVAQGSICELKPFDDSLGCKICRRNSTFKIRNVKAPSSNPETGEATVTETVTDLFGFIDLIHSLVLIGASELAQIDYSYSDFWKAFYMVLLKSYQRSVVSFH